MLQKLHRQNSQREFETVMCFHQVLLEKLVSQDNKRSFQKKLFSHIVSSASESVTSAAQLGSDMEWGHISLEDSLKPIAELVDAIWSTSAGLFGSDWTCDRRIFRRSKKRFGRHSWRHWIQRDLIGSKSPQLKQALKKFLAEVMGVSTIDEDADNAVSNKVVRDKVHEFALYGFGLYQLPYEESSRNESE